MTTKSPYAIATESFLPTGRPSDGVGRVISSLRISSLGAGLDLSGGSQMDKMEVEANPPGVGDALALVDVVNGESIPKPSFRDIVGGGIVADQRNNIFDSLDVSLTEEDVRVSHTGVYPEIRFFERVHQEIDAKLSKSVIVRLLGKSIGYRALKNRVNALWSTIEALNIIDLNNDYYLIRFAMDADYDRPLILGIVIDGSFQAIDYEGLTVICFSCAKYGHSKEVCGQTEAVTVPPAPGHKSKPPADGRFGPWMQVTNRKHRPDITSKGMNNEGPSVVLKGGSRFKALDLLGEDNQRNASGMEHDSGREPNTQGIGATVRVSSVVGEAEGSAQALVEGVMHSTGRLREVVLVNPVMVDEGCDGSGDGHVEQPCWEEVGVSPRVAAKDWVSKFASSLNMGIMAAISSVVNDVNNVVVGDANYEPRDENVSIEAEPLLTSSHVSDVLAIMEPRVSGLTADNFIRRAGFDYSYRVEANGFSGGIWVMWKNIVNIDVVAVDNQFIHASCFVVASQQRSALWGQLRALDPGLAHPWILGGDFSVICSSAERHGGSVRRSGVYPQFCDFLFQYGLLDIGFYGPRFTWQRGDLVQWLDRCLCNGKWCEKFALSDVAHLPRLRLDHSPLLLTTTPVGKNGLSNKEMFGHIGRRKAHVLACIKGVELALDRAESPFLIKLESNLKNELSEILEQEEGLWYQKSRSTWISQGDRNTKYFHASTMIRRRRNTVSSLEFDNGDCSDPNCYGDVISFCRWFWDEVVFASTRHASNVRPRAGMCWLPPPRGWVKVNVDGAVGDSPIMSASGGVIRDEAGEWLLGFAHSIGSCSILCAELWTAFDSPLFAWQRGFRKVILELDNMQVVLILSGESSALGDNLLVVQIKELFVRQWDIRVRHIVREANKVADGRGWFEVS
ncbi:hypothetical protein GQ457_11G022240 [Hibiscus cannabinus]